MGHAILQVKFPCDISVILIPSILQTCGMCILSSLVGVKTYSLHFSAYIRVSGCYGNRLKQSFLAHELICNVIVNGSS